jgi:hypothetical protein
MREGAMRIFLSHSHRDRAIAEALTKLLTGLFGKRLEVQYSSDQSAGGGVPPGAQWLPWITRHIAEADATYVLLTPNSMQKSWVLWESGAAAGVALATHAARGVVPITFGLSEDDIPNPFVSTQCVRGDTLEAGGVHRLLQDLNLHLQSPLTELALQATVEAAVPPFFDKIKAALRESTAIASLLASVPASFKAAELAGLWVTSFEFTSGAGTLCHADLVELKADAARRLTGKSRQPRTEGRARPFLNEIEAEVANRHLVGHWKNLSDMRYFGTVHLAVQTGECLMEGSYTCLANDVTVGSGPWQWVRVDPASAAGVDLARVALQEPREVRKRLAAHSKHAGPLTLAAVTG